MQQLVVGNDLNLPFLANIVLNNNGIENTNYIGWRLRAPAFARKTLDWVNKISPVDLD